MSGPDGDGRSAERSPSADRALLSHVVEKKMQHPFAKTGRLGTNLLVAGSLVAMCVPFQTAVAQHGSRPERDIVVQGRRPVAPIRPPTVVDKTINLVGAVGAKENEKGSLRISDRAVAFISDRSTSTIPMGAIRSISLEHTSKPLLRGLAGTVAGLAPNGGGQVYGAIRPGAEMLTIFYGDEYGALHGVVLLLPKSAKAAVADAFARAGLQAESAGMAEIAVDRRRMGIPRSRGASLGSRLAVVIAMPRSDSTAMPAAFAASAYEQLVAQSARSGLFAVVWRAGDRRAAPDSMSMRVRVTGFRKGNAGVRGAIPVFGMLAGKTLITADVVLLDADGSVLLDREVEGSKRMTGESIAATKSLAQRVTGAVSKVPGFVKGPPVSTDYGSDVVAAR